MHRFSSCLAAVAVLSLAVATSGAADPGHDEKPGTKAAPVIVEDHLHNSGGNDWHVQLELNLKRTRLATVVVYSQACGQTGFRQRVPLDANGGFNVANEPLANGKGTWSVQGTFSAVARAEGTWSLTAGDCTASGTFQAQDKEGHFQIGNPYEYAPSSVYGSSLEARRLRRLKYETRRNAFRFDTVAEAARQGYVLSTETTCPGFRHARKRGTVMWGELLNPRAPQSLIFWCDSASNFRLAAFMYRADADSRPDTFGDMLQWHRHSSTAAWMTHVWLARNSEATFATCAPFQAFARDGTIRYEPYVVDAMIDKPCSDTETSPPAPPG